MSLFLTAVATSAYQLLKLKVLHVVPLSKDAVHIYIGVACFVLAVTVLRIRPTSLKAVLPGLLVAFAMEILDVRDELVYDGHVLWAASLKDVVNTNLIPLALTLLFRIRAPKDAKGRNQRGPRSV